MGDVMLYGVLRMPFDMAMSGYLSQRQFYDRVQEAARRLEAAEARLAEIDATPLSSSTAPGELLDMLGRVHPYAMPLEDFKRAEERLERAVDLQQPLPVPDQAAIVWRGDLMSLMAELQHKRSVFDDWKKMRAQQAAAPTWGAVHTVGDMVRNLLTLDQAAPIFTAFHVTIHGERRCRTREVIISKERVVDGKWIDSARKDVPYTHIVWAKPDERVQQATAPGTLPGWKLVPVEPTVDMVTHGFESEPDEFFSPGEDWDAYAEMTGCQKAAHRARLCYAAMLAAAPAASGNTPEIPDGSTSATGIPEAQQTVAARDVLAERQRQVTIEDWTPEHDDAHPCGEIAAFAALYAMPSAARDWPATETGYGDTFGAALCPEDWQPKFGDRRRELVKAGALVLAEIDRMDRAAASKRGA